jgi:alpha-D-xyloside xylohydrolase
MFRLSLLAACCLHALPVPAAVPFDRTAAGVIIRLDDVTLRLSSTQPGVLRVEGTREGRFSDRPSLVLVPAEPRPLRVEAHATELRVATDGVEAVVTPRTGQVAFFRPSERTPFLVASQHQLQPVEIAGDRGVAIAQRFSAEADQGLYGLGTYQDGVMDWRGRSVRLAQSNTVSALPVLVSSQGWGLLWHNTSRTIFADDRRSFTFESVIGDGIDYFVIATTRLDAAIAAYRHLTGRAPLFPRSAYGYWQSKERYETADELLAVAREYRERRLPIDNLVLDWNWWPTFSQWSGMEWDRARFPDPAAMSASLHRLNFNLMVSIWPAVGVDSALHRDLAAIHGLLPGDHWAPAHVVDAWSAAPRALYWKRVKEGLLDRGVDAWWMDATEPVFLNVEDRYVTEEFLVANGGNASGSFARQLNTYSLAATRGAWEMQRAAAPDKRVFVLTRSSFAGQQRHAAVLWSGDIQASWKVFHNQIAAGLNYSLGGMPYWTTDIGGFGVRFRYPRGLEDPAFRELYVRWFQYAVFSPIFRAHGTDVPREIWRFGDETSAEYRALAAAGRLRYRLLPYIYSLAGDVTHRDGTIYRPLVMDFPADPRSRKAAAQYLFGPSLLVSPVTQALQHRTSKVEEAISSERLTDSAGRGPGVLATYYRGTNFETRVAQRMTEVLRQPWYRALPRELDGHPYSVRFEGRLQTLTAGRYRFGVSTNGGIRLRVNGRVVIDRWDNTDDNHFDGTVDLPADRWVALVIEHRQPKAETTGLLVDWEYPGLARETWSADGRFARNLPRGADWIDFWTGVRSRGGGEIRERVPLERVPLDVRAGAILPLGPDLQWTGEKSADPLELRIYPGADGQFTLYEDAGEGYGYEHGAFTTIPFEWDDSRGVLKIGARVGGYPGMLAQRSFHIVRVRPGHGIGTDSALADRVVVYTGRALSVDLGPKAASRAGCVPSVVVACGQLFTCLAKVAESRRHEAAVEHERLARRPGHRSQVAHGLRHFLDGTEAAEGGTLHVVPVHLGVRARLGH